MRGRLLAAATAAFVLACTAQAAGAQQRDRDRLDVYTAVVQADQLRALADQGFELNGVRDVAGGTEVQLVLSKGQRAQLARDGIKTTLTRVKGGKTVKEFAAEQSENGFTVWRSWDEPGGFRDQMYAAARNNPQLAKLEVIGTTIPGPRDPRAQAHPGRARPGRRQPPGGPLQLHAARARVDRQRGQPAPDEPLHRPLAGERPGDQEPAQGHRAVVHPRREPRRLRVHVRRRAAVAQEPARQQRRRADRGRRRRRPEPQLPEPLQVRRGGLLLDHVERHVPRPGAGVGAGDAWR